MSDRAALRADFLNRALWGSASAEPLAGDASGRRYFRLRSAQGSLAILMDAPPEAGEDVRPFLRIGGWLRGIGLSAPEVLAEDEAAGFLLLEDLGDALFSRVAEGQPEAEALLYCEAVRVILRVHEAPPPEGLVVYDGDRLADFAALAVEAYARTDPAPFAAAMRPHLAPLDGPFRVCLRDYHAENLLWLPGRTGVARVGLLDFQDALLAHPVYDLVSLLQDARRDVTPDASQMARALYLSESGTDPETLDRDLALCGAQRALRILGVFARLAASKNKPGYLGLIPRVWGHLMGNLAHPSLEEIRALVAAALPPPTPDYLGSLRATA